MISNIIEFTIDMEPRPQLRPRFSARNGFVQAFPPKENKLAMEKIRESLELYRENMPFPKPLAIGLEVTFWKTKPKSVSQEFPIGKADLSNYIKMLEDAMEGYLFENDSQIVSLVAYKRYGAPRVEVKLWEQP